MPNNFGTPITQKATIAQSFKDSFNSSNPALDFDFSIRAGCAELAYAKIPSEMEIHVSLKLVGIQKNKKSKSNNGTNVLKIKLTRENVPDRTAEFSVMCGLNNDKDQLKVSVLDFRDNARDGYFKFAEVEGGFVARRSSKNASGRVDVVEHLKDQISNYWFADTVNISSSKPGSAEFAKLVQSLWPSNIEKTWETGSLQLSDRDEAGILNLVCALVFVDVFRRMISEVLCTKPKPDDREDDPETQDVDQLDADGTKADKKDKFDWNCIPYLKEIIGGSADYRQKITDIRLEPQDVVVELDKQGLKFSPVVVDQVCSALSSGGHLILTGIPGCGKTCLADALAKAAKVGSVVATANPCWSTDDLIGRYMPAVAPEKENGTVLEFKEGLFLKAIRQDGWLIIDELNRAPIDSCFGELFTVLSGKQVDLPFQTSKSKSISIVPEKTSTVLKKESAPDDSADCDRYVMQKNFRIICTMNDVDSVSLNALSFALQRRFNIVHVDMPDAEDRKTLFKDYRKEVVDSYQKFIDDTNSLNEATQKIDEVASQLFAAEEDFISMGMVGLAQPKEIIRNSISRMIEKSSQSGNGWKLREFKNDDERERFLISGIAMGVVMKVYPQLVNRPENIDLNNVMNLLKDAFDDEPLYLRPDEPDSPTIRKFLSKELKRCCPQAPDTWN